MPNLFIPVWGGGMGRVDVGASAKYNALNHKNETNRLKIIVVNIEQNHQLEWLFNGYET